MMALIFAVFIKFGLNIPNRPAFQHLKWICHHFGIKLKYLIQVLFLAVLVVLTGCDSKNSGQFSKSDCDMKLTTAIWYATFDKGTYSKAELLIGTTIAAYKLSGFELDEKELRNQSNVVQDVGTGQFKEKAIPA
jgi:hypothetical protein